MSANNLLIGCHDGHQERVSRFLDIIESLTIIDSGPP